VLVNEDDEGVKRDTANLPALQIANTAVLADLQEVPNESAYFTNLSQAFYSKKDDSNSDSPTGIDSSKKTEVD